MALNQALTTLRYNPNAFNGDANLNIIVNDNGNTGGTAKTATQNITLKLANDISASNFASFAVSNPINPNDTLDRYRFTLTTPTRNFSLLLGSLTANYDVYLLNNQGTVLKSSTNTGLLPELINSVNLAPGEYFIEVRRIGTSPRNTAGYRFLF
jgi:hypothetical protein